MTDDSDTSQKNVTGSKKIRGKVPRGQSLGESNAFVYHTELDYEAFVQEQEAYTTDPEVLRRAVARLQRNLSKYPDHPVYLKLLNEKKLLLQRLGRNSRVIKAEIAAGALQQQIRQQESLVDTLRKQTKKHPGDGVYRRKLSEAEAGLASLKVLLC